MNLMRQLLRGYFHADPDSGGAPPATSAPAPSEDTVDVDWGSVTPDAPGSDETHEFDDQGQDPPPPPASPPASTAAPQTGTPTTPVQPQPAAPTVPAQAAPPASPPPPQPSAEEVAKQQAEVTEKVITALADRYKGQLTEEMVRDLAVSPETVLPRLLASAVFDAVSSMQGLMQQQVPQVVEQTTRKAETTRKVAEEFFKENHDLMKPEYKVALDEAARMYKTLHPNASRADAIKGVGKLARSALGLPDPQPGSGAAASPPASAPATRSAAFVPAAPGGAARPSARGPQQPNEWTDLIDPD